MNVYYDFEFAEFGHRMPLLPISLGMVRDDGKELYAIINRESTILLAKQHPWLRENVLPSLPVKTGWAWDPDHPDYQYLMSREQLAEEVRQFITGVPGPQLWGWYCSYDHVLLAQLFGRMIDLPEGIPMHSNDLKQDAADLSLPPMPGITEHHALSDAREIRWRYHWLQNNNYGSCPCAPEPYRPECTLT